MRPMGYLAAPSVGQFTELQSVLLANLRVDGEGADEAWRHLLCPPVHELDLRAGPKAEDRQVITHPRRVLFELRQVHRSAANRRQAPAVAACDDLGGLAHRNRKSLAASSNCRKHVASCEAGLPAAAHLRSIKRHFGKRCED
eukprot:scaffold13405_cov57-Phaeocystis_antarctica.AAC.3